MDEERPANLGLACHFLAIGNARASLEALNGAGGDLLGLPEYWSVRAGALRGLDRFEEAADAARRGLAIAPDNVALLDGLAMAELQNEHYTDAERALDRALELEPESPLLHGHMALTLASAGDDRAARAHADRALALAPESDHALRVRAQVAYNTREQPAVVRLYAEELLRRVPNDEVGHAILGLQSARERKVTQSARELAEAARIDPSDRQITAAAREVKVFAHPVLAPVRPMWRFGRWRSYYLVLAISTTLGAAHQTTLRLILAAIWLPVIALSWFAPPILRLLERRKYGG